MLSSQNLKLCIVSKTMGLVVKEDTCSLSAASKYVGEVVEPKLRRWGMYSLHSFTFLGSTQIKRLRFAESSLNPKALYACIMSQQEITGDVWKYSKILTGLLSKLIVSKENSFWDPD